MSDTAKVIEFQPAALEQWRSEGLRLGERERSAHSLMWDIGDWWNRGEAYGERAQVVTAGDWTGPKHGTCRQCGPIAEKWDVLWRQSTLSFEHFRLVGTRDDAEELIRWCAANPDAPRTTQELKTRMQQLRRADREEALGTKIKAFGDKHYGVLYADPPWRLEPYSRETGLNRAADNHYPTMSLDEIKALAVPAADDCVLFLWATVPMLPEAFDVMDAWGFTYKSHFVWLKDHQGTGYWNRNQHELLLIGTRGNIPAPAPGEQFGSVIEAPTSAHSSKPMAFAEMIEEMFPHLPALEMFARGPRLGWDVWGNQAEAA